MPEFPLLKLKCQSLRKEVIKRLLFSGLLILLTLFSCSRDKHIFWSIGREDHSSADLALGPDGFRDFLARDFGFEDKYFIIGHSKDEESFPYVLPGPVDTWGGTWSTSGWRTHQIEKVYEIASPLFKRVEIDLGKRYGRGEKFVIEAKNSSRKNIYVRKAILNGLELKSFSFPAGELLKGGSLVLEMGSEPDTTLFQGSVHQNIM